MKIRRKHFLVLLAVFGGLAWLALRRAAPETVSGGSIISASVPSNVKPEAENLELVPAPGSELVKRRSDYGRGTTQEPSSNRGLSITVSDELGVPLANAFASWSSLRSNAESGLGPTNEVGYAPFREECEIPGILRVWRDGYVSTELHVESPRQDTVAVTLETGAILFGTVVAGADRHKVADIHLLAWPADMGAATQDLVNRASRGGDPRGAITKSGADGSFKFDNLRANDRYRLVAAGAGYASPSVTEVALPLTSGVMISVGCLYGIDVQVVPPAEMNPTSFENMRTSGSQALRYAGVESASKLYGATYVMQPSFILPLAGVSPQQEYGKLSSRSYVFVGDIDRDNLGPVPFRFHIAGFYPIDELVNIPRTVNHIQVQVVPLMPVARIGECTVNFVWPQTITRRRVNATMDAGRIIIQKRGGLPPGAVMPIEVLAPAFVDSIPLQLPYGEYTLQYQNISTRVTVPSAKEPPITLSVNGSRASAMVDLSAFGGISVRVKREPGVDISGPLSFMILHDHVVGRGDSAPVSSMCFSGAPYFIFPLKAGPYTLKSAGSPSRHVSSSLVQHTVSPGSVDEVDMSASAH